MNRFLRCLPLIVVLAGCQQPALMPPVTAGPAMRQPAAMPQPVAPQSPAQLQGPQTRPVTLADLTPARVAALLPKAPLAGLVDDEDEGDVSANFFGWWGESGRRRALTAFSKEEGRTVSWHDDPRGHALLMNVDNPADAAQALAMAFDPNLARTAVTRYAVPNDAGKRMVRHLKLFRRQKVVTLAAKDLTIYKVTPKGRETSPISLGYIAAAHKGEEIFVGLYKPGGQLLLAAAGLLSQVSAPPPSPTPAPQDPGYVDPGDPGYGTSPGYGDPGYPAYGGPGYPATGGAGYPAYGGPGYTD